MKNENKLLNARIYIEGHALNRVCSDIKILKRSILENSRKQSHDGTIREEDIEIINLLLNIQTNLEHGLTVEKAGAK